MKRTATKRRPTTTTNAAMRAKVRDQACLNCAHRPVDPAHLIDRSLADDHGDPRAVIALCRLCHDRYDAHELDLLPLLEPRLRVELAFAVERFGLLRTLERVTGVRWAPRDGGS